MKAAWKTMNQQIGDRHTVQVCVNLLKIGELQGKRIIPEKSLDNPVISLLYGGVLEAAGEKSPTWD